MTDALILSGVDFTRFPSLGDATDSPECRETRIHHACPSWTVPWNDIRGLGISPYRDDQYHRASQVVTTFRGESACTPGDSAQLKCHPPRNLAAWSRNKFCSVAGKRLDSRYVYLLHAILR